MKRRVLVAGASIAGTTLAWWLGKAGFCVTVLERAPAFRDGGQNVDVRGAARTVLQRMKLEQSVAAAGTGEKGIAFVDEHGRVVARFDRELFGENGPTAELEILRGDLARLLYDDTVGRAAFRFGDRISAIDDESSGVRVSFEHGEPERFDLVLVAEGESSSTRARMLPYAVQRRPLDVYMGYFTIPRGRGDGEIARWYNAPGGRSVFLRPDHRGTTRAVLTMQQASQGYEDLPLAEQKRVLRERFADAGWETPRVLAGLDDADDLYFEFLSQVKMERWSSGRVAFTGDAAWCTTPLAGLGTTLAITGAYVLAGELARHADHLEAFASYERIMRPFVEQAQGVPKFAPRLAQPRTRSGIALQQKLLALATKPGVRALTKRLFQPGADKVDLPEYAAAE